LLLYWICKRKLENMIDLVRIHTPNRYCSPLFFSDEITCSGIAYLKATVSSKGEGGGGPRFRNLRVGEGSPLPLRAGRTASQRLTGRDERGWGGGELVKGGRRESGGGVRVRVAAPPGGGGGVLIGRWGGGGAFVKWHGGWLKNSFVSIFPSYYRIKDLFEDLFRK
jgi:hypothetical protein